jgi:hypothetical protein
MRRWFRDNNIKNQQVSGRRWKVAVDDLPDNYEKNPDPAKPIAEKENQT